MSGNDIYNLADGWLELESDPGLFTLLLEDMGVPDVQVSLYFYYMIYWRSYFLFWHIPPKVVHFLTYVLQQTFCLRFIILLLAIFYFVLMESSSN